MIPPKLRDRVLDELHWEHPGVCSLKAIARSYVWWPNLDQEIETRVAKCTPCQSVRRVPERLPLHPWKWPARPFQRIHIDFFEYGKEFFLVMIDSHSKWIDVKYMMDSTTAESTIDELRLIFAEHGLPEEIVSDNGPQFSSHRFKEFAERNGIKHTLVAPYHPASNGAAERTVRVVKEAFTKHVVEGCQERSLKHRIADFLLRYRVTPHSVTGVSPAEMMTKRKLRTRLSLVKPSTEKHVENRQINQKFHFDKSTKERRFEPGEMVRVKNPRPKLKSDKWLLGEVVEVRGSRNYSVKVGKTTKMVHADHLVRASDCKAGEEPQNVQTENIRPDPYANIPVVPDHKSVVGISDTSLSSGTKSVSVQSTLVKSSSPGTSAKSFKSYTPVKPIKSNHQSTPSVTTEVPSHSQTVSRSPLVPVRRSSRAVKPVDKLDL